MPKKKDVNEVREEFYNEFLKYLKKSFPGLIDNQPKSPLTTVYNKSAVYYLNEGKPINDHTYFVGVKNVDKGGSRLGIVIWTSTSSPLIYLRNNPDKFIEFMNNKNSSLDLVRPKGKGASIVNKGVGGNREISLYTEINGKLDNNRDKWQEYFDWYVKALKALNLVLEDIDSGVIKLSESKQNSSKIESNTDKKAENIILYGVPGSGKSYNIKTKIAEVLGKENSNVDELYNGLEESEKIKRIVFHPDYTYSDFVGQILPGLDDDNNIVYEFKSGPFTEILKAAINSKDNEPHFLIIEEINRGNAPAIFGDIFQLLDRDDNGRSEYSINNEDIINKLNEKTESEEDKQVISSVYLPSNLWIFATMNTSDQNVYTLDTAFQRRWNMELIPNKFTDEQHSFGIEGLHNDKKTNKATWREFAEAVNRKLAESDNMLASGDKSLGAWFVKPDTKDAKGNVMLSKEVFANKVLKYLWDDAFKFNREDVFSNDMQTLENVIYEKGNIRDDFKDVFNAEFIDKLGLKSKEEIEKLENNKEIISQPEDSDKIDEN